MSFFESTTSGSLAEPIDARPTAAPLLTAADPAPVLLENVKACGPAVCVCDHGGRTVPAKLNGLGLDPADFDRHIAWDIGALAVARLLAQRFDMPLASAVYSRLVIDPNRALDDPTLIVSISDDVLIPANADLSAAAAAQRVNEIFSPYHRAVAAALESRRALGVAAPALVSVHSFTPEMRGFARPWHIGVLWDGDPRIAVPLMAALRARGDVTVGDNQPYSGRGTLGGTVEDHALTVGLPNVLIEIRQDLIADDDGAARWAAIVGDALAPILADGELYRAEIHPRFPA